MEIYTSSVFLPTAGEPAKQTQDKTLQEAAYGTAIKGWVGWS